jgi:hypothetical protein
MGLAMELSTHMTFGAEQVEQSESSEFVDRFYGNETMYELSSRDVV